VASCRQPLAGDTGVRGGCHLTRVLRHRVSHGQRPGGACPARVHRGGRCTRWPLPRSADPGRPTDGYGKPDLFVFVVHICLSLCNASRMSISARSLSRLEASLEPVVRFTGFGPYVSNLAVTGTPYRPEPYLLLSKAPRWGPGCHGGDQLGGAVGQAIANQVLV
jgi:hypothetical protein